MQVRIQKLGDSLAVCIPQPLAAQSRIAEGMVVEVFLEEGRLVVNPPARPRPTLEQLLAGITDDNLHGEVDP